MYVFGRKAVKPKKRTKIIKFLFVLVIVVATGLLLWYLFRPKLSKGDPTSILVPTKFDTAAQKHISEPLYELDLPADWKESARTNTPYREVSWIGTARESISRQLDVYTDSIPSTLPVNRMVPVSGKDNSLSVGQMSSNCIDFTGNAAQLTPEQAGKSKPQLTKWEDVQFWCDVPNELRNVIAASSPEGINRVSVTGPISGKHNYFFVYTDHTAHPSDNTFLDILRSFKAR